MKKMRLISLFLIFISAAVSGQESTPQSGDTKNWFIVLPLRFTQLQNHHTMLSGIKLGRVLTPAWDISLSVYHSFYLKSFKAKANLAGFENQPRLYINCLGGEVSYHFIRKEKLSLATQIYLGWGFMKYDLKEQNFESKQVNFFALEPTLNFEYSIKPYTVLGLGVGYRPFLINNTISFTSDSSSGEIPVSKDFPNGLNIILTLKGFL
jgi:hypothetical protein